MAVLTSKGYVDVVIAVPNEGVADDMADDMAIPTKGDAAAGMVGVADDMAVPKGGASKGGSLPN